MPIKVKYVGPLDDKTFRDYFFVRNVTDNAVGANGIPGEDAVELPDNIANEALKHRNVFMQWNAKVPPEVKALRRQRPAAMLKEGTESRSHWFKRLVVAEMLEDDTPRKKQIRAKEIAGAKAEVDRAQALVDEAHRLEEIYAIEEYDPSAPVGVNNVAPIPAPSVADEVSALVAEMREALNNANSEKQALRAELLALQTQMQRDGRLTPDEAIVAPSTGEAEVVMSAAATVTIAPESAPEEFPAIFDEPAQPAIKRGRPPAAK